MSIIESIGKTIDEAIENGLKELNTTLENVEVSILKQPGMFSKAKVKLTIINEEKKDIVLSDAVEKADVVKSSDGIETTEGENIQAQKNEQKSTFEKVEGLCLAGEILQEMLYRMNFKGTINQEEKGKVIVLNVKGDDVGIIIGRGGQTLEALSLILNNIMRNKVPNDKRKVILNFGNFQEKREDELRKLATEARDKCLEIQKTVRMEVMNSYERRIVHSEVAEDKRIVCESFGVEPYRYITIRPADSEA